MLLLGQLYTDDNTNDNNDNNVNNDDDNDRQIMIAWAHWHVCQMSQKLPKQLKYYIQRPIHSIISTLSSGV